MGWIPIAPRCSAGFTTSRARSPQMRRSVIEPCSPLSRSEPRGPNSVALGASIQGDAMQAFAGTIPVTSKEFEGLVNNGGGLPQGDTDNPSLIQLGTPAIDTLSEKPSRRSHALAQVRRRLTSARRGFVMVRPARILIRREDVGSSH